MRKQTVVVTVANKRTAVEAHQQEPRSGAFLQHANMYNTHVQRERARAWMRQRSSIAPETEFTLSLVREI